MSSEDPNIKLWQLIVDLSEQLSQNRAVTVALQAQVAEIKNQAVHANTGFPLRRFNTDLSQEEFASSVEEFASKLVLENRTLQHENKQLSILLREYEATLEGVMGKFRGLAHATQTHELALHGHYSTALLALSHTQGESSLLQATQLNSSLERLGARLRMVVRLQNGELPPDGNSNDNEIGEAGGYLPPREPPLHSLGSSASGLSKTGREDRDDGPPLDWALERESEICRLESENRALRQMLGLLPEGETQGEQEGNAPAAGENVEVGR